MTLTRVVWAVILAAIVVPRGGGASSLEARCADVVVRLGQAAAESTRAGVSAERRAKAVAFEVRWQAATLLLLRGLELRSSAEGPFRAPPPSPGAMSMPLLPPPISPGQAARAPWAVLETYRLLSVRPGTAPFGCQPLAACIESVATYGNRALDLWSCARPPDGPVCSALDGLERALECSERAAGNLRFRMGLALEPSAAEPHGRAGSLADRWWAVDSLERLLLTEGGANANEVDTYADWIRRGGLSLPPTESLDSDLWHTARELVSGCVPRSPPTERPIGSIWPREDPAVGGRATSLEVEVEWFDILGRRVWSSGERLRRRGLPGDPLRTLPSGVYFVRGRSRDSTEFTRVFVRD